MSTTHTPTPTEAKLLFRVRRAAEMLDISTSQAYKLIELGQLRAVRIGSSIRVPAESVRELAEKGAA